MRGCGGQVQIVASASGWQVDARAALTPIRVRSRQHGLVQATQRKIPISFQHCNTVTAYICETLDAYLHIFQIKLSNSLFFKKIISQNKFELERTFFETYLDILEITDSVNYR